LALGSGGSWSPSGAACTRRLPSRHFRLSFRADKVAYGSARTGDGIMDGHDFAEQRAQMQRNPPKKTPGNRIGSGHCDLGSLVKLGWMNRAA
jgi:hypothetical protein